MHGVTGIVLAGGQGRRMGSVDKGLQPLDGRPMVAWAIERLAPQVDEILLNANQNLEAYARLRTANKLTVKVTRRGKPMTLDFNIK